MSICYFIKHLYFVCSHFTLLFPGKLVQRSRSNFRNSRTWPFRLWIWCYLWEWKSPVHNQHSEQFSLRDLHNNGILQQVWFNRVHRFVNSILKTIHTSDGRGLTELFTLRYTEEAKSIEAKLHELKITEAPTATLGIIGSSINCIIFIQYI